MTKNSDKDNNKYNFKNASDIKKLFDLCLEIPKPDRLKFIENSDFDKNIKKEVLSLLSVNSDNFNMTSSIMDSVQESLDTRPLSKGMQVDAYTLISPLGQGGQGEVWLAERNINDFNHQVAIKFLKPIFNEKDLLRFENEREILAQLQHPYIAQLIGGGELSDKRPYMILERIKGTPILDFCVKNNYKINDYLRIFEQICQAINFAHSHLIIHRDIKPSNIFVDANGVVKVLDFGIAKALSSENQNTDTIPILTLAYSSPEQLTGSQVSTATDVYALGLLLYEMLTGKRAQHTETETPAELIQEITDKTPTIPSQVDINTKVNRRYSLNTLKGDIDNLIMMAVRKEPQRRYQNISDMIADINHYLNGEPLIATGDKLSYKTKKLIKRNPLSSALILIVLVFMIVLPVILYQNQVKLKKQRDLEISARKEAQLQSQIANRTTDFLFNILESASPLGSNGEAINLSHVLTMAEKRINDDLEDQPLLKSELLRKLASISHYNGNETDSTKQLLESLKIAESMNDKAGMFKVYDSLALSFYYQGDINNSKIYHEKAKDISDSIDDVNLIAWHKGFSMTLYNYYGNRKKTRDMTIGVLGYLKKHNIISTKLLGRVYNEASIAFKSHDDELALKYINLALSLGVDDFGKMHPNYTARLQNKGSVLISLERKKEAEIVLKELTEITATLFGENHIMYSKALGELGYLYHDSGRFSETEEIYIKAIAISKNSVGQKNIDYIIPINNLAYLYEDMGKYDLAENLYRESLKLRQLYYSENTTRVASSQSNLARLLTKIGQLEEAQKLLSEVMPVFESKKRSNLYNYITQSAIYINQKSDDSCNKGINLINENLSKLEQISERSWRRMHAELWIAQLAKSCHDTSLANKMFLRASERAINIYDADSDGLLRIHKLVQLGIN